MAAATVHGMRWCRCHIEVRDVPWVGTILSHHTKAVK